MAEFEVSQEIATLGLSLFVLGWAVGPLIWAPMSELYGRQYVYFVTLRVLAFFNAGTAGAQNVETVLVLRFLGGCFGASPFTNAAGVIADMFAARERGLAMSLFSAAPFMGPAGLPFIGVAIGMLASVVYNVFIENPRYLRNVDKGGGVTIPEDRLPPCLVGAVALPIGLFWFAWTNSPSLPWAASTAAGIPFGFAMVLVFLSVMNYLIDSYTIYAASVLAANSVLRCIFGFAFPLFTTQMYAGLGIHWASTVPALLAVVCLPFPFLFYRYGHVVRKRSKFAREAAEFARGLREKATTSDESDEVTKDEE
ncbi:Major facilitator superfamily [Lasiodiplodia theobromae]|uniref:Major facilitator superfamily n=1 Tax=Lasiodiplodia theobromae TaxID=45133 RepID=A0A8H7MCF2_9PEZI|nr:Major facilitator superfamily [Lasiodiplodia theobromae]